MRLFLAILLSEEMKNALINIQNEMYDKGIRGNFTTEENMHLTLAFIGDYPDPLPVTEALEAMLRRPVVGGCERLRPAGGSCAENPPGAG